MIGKVDKLIRCLLLTLGVVLAIEAILLLIVGELKMDLIAGIIILACSYLAWKHLKGEVIG
ncbi:MAG: hypothetical protein J7L79_01545 [Thaumarchaeota archaeon]|nr:hypothetical protein [Nitrososphaerota archaeon]